MPDLEMALALKFAALDSPNRRENKKRQDKVDFISMVAAHAEDFAEDRLFSLGETGPRKDRCLVSNNGNNDICSVLEFPFRNSVLLKGG